MDAAHIDDHEKIAFLVQWNLVEVSGMMFTQREQTNLHFFPRIREKKNFQIQAQQ